MSATVTALYRYPVKGLSAEPLEQADVFEGRCVAFDRAFAIANGPTTFDPTDPRHLPKNRFLMLMSNERLAALQTRFDPQTLRLTIMRDGKPVTSGNLDDRIGRQVLQQFLAAYMSDDLRGAPSIVHAADHSFSDTVEQVWSLINLASVRELERVVGRSVDPLRFRANIYVDGLEPWSEFDWIDGSVRCGDQPLFHVLDRTERCAATNVDPTTGARDMMIPRTLLQAFGHMDMGVYLQATADGMLAIGDTLELY